MDISLAMKRFGILPLVPLLLCISVGLAAVAWPVSEAHSASIEMSDAQVKEDVIFQLRKIQTRVLGGGGGKIKFIGATNSLTAAGAVFISRISTTSIVIRGAMFESGMFLLDRLLDLLGLGGLRKSKHILKAIKHALESETPEEFMEKLGKQGVNELLKAAKIPESKRNVLKKLYAAIRKALAEKINGVKISDSIENPACGTVGISIEGRNGKFIQFSAHGHCGGKVVNPGRVPLGNFGVTLQMPVRFVLSGDEKNLKLSARIQSTNYTVIDAPAPDKKNTNVPAPAIVSSKCVPKIDDRPVQERICERKCSYLNAEVDAVSWQRALALKRLTEAQTLFGAVSDKIVGRKKTDERYSLELKKVKAERIRKKADPETKKIELDELDKEIGRINGIRERAARKIMDFERQAEPLLAAVRKEEGKFIDSFSSYKSTVGKRGQCMRACLARAQVKPSVKLDRKYVSANSSLGVTYVSLWPAQTSVGGEKAGPWIGIVRAGEPELSGADTGKLVADRYFVSSPNNVGQSAKRNLTAPADQGNYEVRLYNGTPSCWSYLAASAPFFVVPRIKLKARYKGGPPKSLDVR
jgi:hypothetical protein